jgi:altronate dehydratase large subunit
MNVKHYKVNGTHVEFDGYVRKGRGKIIGVRNHLVIMPTVFCANRVALEIEKAFDGCAFGEHNENYVVALPHYGGCCHVGFDEALARNILTRIGRHPNVGGLLLVSLGCGQLCQKPFSDVRDFDLYSDIQRHSMTEIECVTIQESGTRKAIEEGIRKTKKLLNACKTSRREHVDGFRKLIFGVLNGGSDPTSGLFANPGVGHLSDAIMGGGGTVVFSQITELYGAERYLEAKGIKKLQKFRSMLQMAKMMEESLRLMGELKTSQPTPGNIRQGISTISEKAMGSIFKVGYSPDNQIKGVLPISKSIPASGGLYFMEGPGQDLLNLTGMTAGGAQTIVFTTGLGTPIGCAIAPVIKVTANKKTFERMNDDIDIYIPVERIFQEKRSIKELSLESFFPYVMDVLSGRKRTKSELNMQRDFQIREMWIKI